MRKTVRWKSLNPLLSLCINSQPDSFLLILGSGSHMGQLVPSESHCHQKTHLQACDLSLEFYPFFLKSCSFSVENNTLFLFSPL